MTRSTITQKRLDCFVKAMHHVYQFPHPGDDGSTTSAVSSWTPPPAVGGHRGRYLWTDAFGVINLLTLYRLTGAEAYLHYATVLATTVHDILGRQRDGEARLPGATDANPLGGGLRIGKEEADGEDGDGQYHHYLTLWMYALNRLAVATMARTASRSDSDDKKDASSSPSSSSSSRDGCHWNTLAIQLMRAIHPAFVYNRDTDRPRMYWKVTTDLSEPLVRSEGNLDPVDGLVICQVLREFEEEMTTTTTTTTCSEEDNGGGGGPKSSPPPPLEAELRDYEAIVEHKWERFTSRDPLDLGMALWSVHRCEGRDRRAAGLNGLATRALRDLMDAGYFRRPVGRRLAFREFGAVLGVRCALHYQPRWVADAEGIVRGWEDAGVVPDPREGDANAGDLAPITLVMYAAALEPGAFKHRWFDDDKVAEEG